MSGRWRARYRQGDEVTPVGPLDVNREAEIRRLYENLAHESGLAAVGARAAIGDLLAEISRLRKLLPGE